MPPVGGGQANTHARLVRHRLVSKPRAGAWRAKAKRLSNKELRDGVVAPAN
jgi:hypothetical protein